MDCLVAHPAISGTGRVRLYWGRVPSRRLFSRAGRVAYLIGEFVLVVEGFEVRGAEELVGASARSVPHMKRRKYA
eukprot:1551563-Rhodomonas_salina.1